MKKNRFSGEDRYTLRVICIKLAMLLPHGVSYKYLSVFSLAKNILMKEMVV